MSSPAGLCVLVVDDEPPARARLLQMLAEIEFVAELREAADGPSALAQCQAERVDVAVLDVRMPGMDGLELASHLARLSEAPSVIFATAFDSHALAAFDARAVDYLLKPVRRERLREAIERAMVLSARPGSPTLAEVAEALGGPASHVSAHVNGSLVVLPATEIRYFRAQDKYVVAGHPSGSLLLDDSLRQLEARFGERFTRVHRNALVNLEFVEELRKVGVGRWAVALAGVNEAIEVSRRMAPSVRKIIRSGEIQG